MYIKTKQHKQVYDPMAVKIFLDFPVKGQHFKELNLFWAHKKCNLSWRKCCSNSDDGKNSWLTWPARRNVTRCLDSIMTPLHILFRLRANMKSNNVPRGAGRWKSTTVRRNAKSQKQEPARFVSEAGTKGNYRPFASLFSLLIKSPCKTST